MWIRYDADVIGSVGLDQLRLRDFAGSVPWRRWRSRHGQAHLSGSYWAATTGGHIVYESRLELARLLLADFDPQVSGVWAQPCRLVAAVAGTQRRHVPDFLLGSPSGEVAVVNVKPADRLADPKIADALRWPGELFTEHGWRYEVWSSQLSAGSTPPCSNGGPAGGGEHGDQGARGAGQALPSITTRPRPLPRYRSTRQILPNGAARPAESNAKQLI